MLRFFYSRLWTWRICPSLTPPIMDIQIVIFFWCWFQFHVLIGLLSCYFELCMICNFFFDLSLIHVITLSSLYKKKCFCIFHFGQVEKLNPKYFPTIPCQYLYLSPLSKSFSSNLFHFSPSSSLLLIFKWSSFAIQDADWTHPSSNSAAQVN